MAQQYCNLKDRQNSSHVESPTRPGESAVEVVGNISIDPIIITAGSITMINLDANSWQQVVVSGVTGQVNILIQSRRANTSNVLLEYDNSASATSGLEIYPGGNTSKTIPESIDIYLRAASGTATVAVEVLEK